MLTPPFKQHLSREFGAEERYHIYQRLIPIHQPAATDPHGLPEKSAKTQNASEKKGIWREKNMFSRQDVQQVFERHLHAWNDESQVKWQGMHGTLPPKQRTHFIGGCPTRCLMRIATVQRSSCKSRTPKKKFPTSISATCSEDTKTRDVNRHDIYWYTTYILCIYVYIKLPYKTSSHCLEDMCWSFISGVKQLLAAIKAAKALHAEESDGAGREAAVGSPRDPGPGAWGRPKAETNSKTNGLTAKGSHGWCWWASSSYVINWRSNTTTND